MKVLKSPEMGRRVDFRQNARELVDEFVRREKVRSDREEKDLADGGGGGGAVEKDTILRPFTQFGPLGIKEETDLVVPAILKYGRELSRVSGGQGDGGGRATLDWTSGYFSLWKGYKREVLREGGGEGRMRIRIVCAAPEVGRSLCMFPYRCRKGVCLTTYLARAVSVVVVCRRTAFSVRKGCQSTSPQLIRFTKSCSGRRSLRRACRTISNLGNGTRRAGRIMRKVETGLFSSFLVRWLN